jgi:hypothetical protein
VSFFEGSGSASDPLCLSSYLAHHFSDFSFWIHHPVNQDDLQFLAHATASDFSVSLKENNWFFVNRYELHAQEVSSMFFFFAKSTSFAPCHPIL